jgi:ubiquinone biosynthesis protein UbiJ|tara:strand:- start:116 stop:376 length:261 start_codon:yes stop_codon:yes gene_type:complete
MDYDALTRKFLTNLQEGTKQSAGLREYIQALGETLSSFRPRTQTEQRRIAMAKEQLSHVKRQTRKLQERIAILEEQVAILEENKDI